MTDVRKKAKYAGVKLPDSWSAIDLTRDKKTKQLRKTTSADKAASAAKVAKKKAKAKKNKGGLMKALVNNKVL